VAELLLFHHIQGLTAGLHAFADELRSAGHTVHTPDLFEGERFATIDEGMAFVRRIGQVTVLDRATVTADALPADLVYVGFSLGVLPAQQLAQTRPGARGAVLLHACLPADEFGGWPDEVAAQIHAMDGDPFFVDDGDIDAARALVAGAPNAALYLYPGDRHLFTDRSLDDYDDTATALALTRILGALSRTATGPGRPTKSRSGAPDNGGMPDAATPGRTTTPAATTRCPCLSGVAYGECCGPLHAGSALAPTAERLMRSRYSAFAVGDAAYLLATWHPSTRPGRLDLDADVRWYGLEILGRSRGGMLDSEGTVEFIARYRSAGQAGSQHESSRFLRDGRRWLYLDGS
jgi:uncharacterized protein YchJ/dienelactone hydrolase